MAHAPTVTMFLDEAPCPRVEVFFPTFAAGTATVTVWALSEDGQVEVQGAVRAPTAGALTRIDYEPPLNVPVSYRAEMFDAAGIPLGYTDSTQVTVPSADTWMHNPAYPAGAVKVTLHRDAGARRSRPVRARASRPLGRARVMMLGDGPRQGLTDLDMSVWADDLVTADKVQALLGDRTRRLPPVICIRVGAREAQIRVPRRLHLGVVDIPEDDVSVSMGFGQTIQRIVGDEADPPLRGVFVPLLTAADLNAYYATAADLNADNLTGADVNRRYDLAGFAS